MMLPETNKAPLSMSWEEFGATANDLAQRCEQSPLYSEARAALLDQLGDHWTSQGFAAIGKTWHDAAEYCRRPTRPY